MATLAEIRAKLQNMENKGKSRYTNEEGDLTFAFWNMAEGDTTTVRFLPDADPDSTFFWKERQLINLTFPGVKGGDTDKEVSVRVPCMDMYGETCPIIAETRPWWNDDSMKEIARKYWKKRAYIMQGFVLDNPLKEDNVPENPIRKFVITPQVFNIIKAALLDPDMEHSPTDYENGTNFIIAKGRKGDYNDYSTSKYARRESPLEEAHLEAIEKYGLFNLSDWMPRKPDAAGVNIIFEMFEASVNGELYDPDRWANHFKPYGMQFESASEMKTETKEEDAPKAEEKPTPPPSKLMKESKAEEEQASKPAASAQDILAKIRSRNAS